MIDIPKQLVEIQVETKSFMMGWENWKGFEGEEFLFSSNWLKSDLEVAIQGTFLSLGFNVEYSTEKLDERRNITDDKLIKWTNPFLKVILLFYTRGTRYLFFYFSFCSRISSCAIEYCTIWDPLLSCLHLNGVVDCN